MLAAARTVLTPCAPPGRSAPSPTPCARLAAGAPLVALRGVDCRGADERSACVVDLDLASQESVLRVGYAVEIGGDGCSTARPGRVEQLGAGTGLYLALLLIIVGTGLLKPNLTAMVGGIYAGHDEQRDAGFSIYSMGVNLGAPLAPLVCGYLRQEVSWELGFGVAAVGMVLALVQYVLGGRGFGPIGLVAENPLPAGLRRRYGLHGLAGFAAFVALVVLEITVLHLPADSIDSASRS